MDGLLRVHQPERPFVDHERLMGFFCYPGGEEVLGDGIILARENKDIHLCVTQVTVDKTT